MLPITNKLIKNNGRFAIIAVAIGLGKIVIQCIIGAQKDKEHSKSVEKKGE